MAAAAGIRWSFASSSPSVSSSAASWWCRNSQLHGLDLSSSMWGTNLFCTACIQSCCRSPFFQLPGGRSRSKHNLIVAKKKSGFAELFLSKRLEQQQNRSKLRPGKVSPTLSVPGHIPRPPYVGSSDAPPFLNEPQIQDEEGIKHMKAAGHLAARVRDFAGTLVKPGTTTDEIDKAVHNMIIDAGAYPSPLGYGGFPKSVCTSVNECICHGIPDSRPLQDGDIINIDVTVYLNGFHGDTSETFFCGNVSDESKQLVEVTRACLEKAIAICGPGVEIKKIGKAIHDYADKYNYGVVRRFVGHGVGQVFHSAPSVLHYRNNEPGRMQIGQTFTIEPMLTIGRPDHVFWNDNWTAVTADGGLSAQFEHTLLITESGVEVLTR